jgi:hypothetical protein
MTRAGAVSCELLCAVLVVLVARGCVDPAKVEMAPAADVMCGAACVPATVRAPDHAPHACVSTPGASAGLDSLGAWPNLPDDLVTRSDESFDALTENGWITLQRDTTDGSGASLAHDPRAPLSPPNVLQFTYARGFQAGHTPAVTFYDLADPVKEAYFGLWWKPSDPWDNNMDSGVNKLAFLLTTETATDGEAALIMFGTDSGPYTIQVVTEFPGDIRRLSPNRTPTLVTLGVWHQVEWYVKFSSTSSTHDGIVRWWLDGVPQGEYTDVMTPDDPGLKEFQIAPTWGGVVGTKTERDFFCYDHARIALPAQ